MLTGEKFPSLLWGKYRPAGEIDAQVFTDINLDKLLHEDVLKILALPCPAPLITARQRIFMPLCDSPGKEGECAASFASQLETLENVSVELRQAYEAFKNAQNKLETLLLFRRYANLYAVFCRKAAELDTGNADSELIIEFTTHFKQLDGQTARLESGLAETAEAASRLSESKLTFTPVGTTLDCPDNEPSITERIYRVAAELGYILPARRPQKQYEVDSFYSDALLRRIPDEADALENLMREFSAVLDPEIIEYRHEIRFYLTLCDFYARAVKAGLPLAFPSLRVEPGLELRAMRDPTLLIKGCEIVPNDADFSETESVWFLTGANGGGKTTFLRGVAVNLILALSGAPVIAKSGAVYPYTAVFTHFPADERFTGSGRLFEEARRANEILSHAKRGAFAFMNETYSGTNSERGLELTLTAARILRDKGATALYVTHFHEVADSDFPILNTVMDKDDSSRRTFRIMKSSALRSSLARDILRKYGLDAESLERRSEVRI